jgi:hypothetical protein
MDLLDPSTEAAYLWLKQTFEGKRVPVTDLTWRVGTSELYALYKAWAQRTKFDVISISDIWGIIQIEYPWVFIIGSKGNRVYTGIRKK